MPNKYTRFTKNEAARLRDELNQHLRPWLEERGLTLELGNARFTDGSMRFINPEFKVPAVAAKADESMIRRALVMHRIAKPGADFSIDNERYQVVEYRPKASKLPWVVLNKRDGKKYLLTDEDVMLRFPQGK